MKRAFTVEAALAVVAIGGAAFWPFGGGRAMTCDARAGEIERGLQAVGSQDPSSPRLAGQWHGQLTVDQHGKTSKLIVDLDQVTGRWAGQFDLPDFGVQDYPVDVARTGRTVTLHLSAAQIEFIGELSKSGDALVGLATTRGHRDSLVLRRAGEAQLSEEFLRLEALSGDSTRVESLSASGEELRQQFNRDKVSARLVMLLSPS